MALSPGAAFLAGFQTMDASNRDWERIAMAQQQQARQFAQQAVENRKKAEAQDFNQMLAMLKREDDNSQFQQQDRRLWAAQNSQNILGNYNAQTSRMGAATSRINQQLDARRLMQQQQYNDDPLGLMGGSSGTGTGTGEPPLPAIPGIDDPQGGPMFNFGGRSYGQDWGPATATVFGGGDDPEDNGLSAFGGPTGAGGREGVAIPAKVLQQTVGGNKADWERAGAEVTLADGTKKILPIADLGTAERIWERNQGPTLDLTPGAVDSLGGTVIRDGNGRQAGVQLPSEIANVRVVPDFQQASSGTVAPEPPDLSLPEPLPSLPWQSASEASVLPPPVAVQELPMPAPANAEPLLPPPSEGYQSFSGVDLTGGMSQQMTQLRREAELAKMQEAEYRRQANQAQSLAVRRRTPAARNAYLSEAKRLSGVAQQFGSVSSEAESYVDELGRNQKAVEKRQDQVGALSVLDGVLPDSTVQTILADASDATKGGLTDQRIKTLTEYNEVRQQNGLRHLSRGIPTAAEVVRTGKLLDAVGKDLEKVGKYEAYQEQAAAIGDTDIKRRDALLSKALEVKPAADIYKQRKAEFDRAVANDILPVPRVDEMPAAPAAAATPASPSDPKAMTQAELQRWSDAKSELGGMLGGKERVKNLIGGGMDLDDFKEAVVQQLRNLEPEGGEDFPSPGQGFSLPRNARSLEDVAYALAEDVWQESGRKPDEKTKPKAENISPPVRTFLQKILSQKDASAAK